ncbi:head GIN domain-containing protein [Sphingomonas hengshuiensis]|uniref:Putative auto-transporter adhesin head GIN domain-containing protein n=1 Tax=Sphingomonas hengshuiensis TaxID=1609977 RepID=A0A7U5BG47_9SPHN|nr:head GIN domain-containing protein [Sphingomonas hengshuiensis]AJP74646.1 hypothetical protein TS85_18685 [Sphingomonas hengshuiensis]
MHKLLIVALLPLAACQSNAEKAEAASPSGPGATRSYAATGFTGVDLRGSDSVDVKPGAAFSVVAEGDPKVLDLLEIIVVGDTLRVGRKRSATNWAWGSDKGARIHVVMPRLQSASVGGSGDLVVERAQGDFTGAVSGSGDLDVRRLDGGAADLSVAGSGTLKIAGTAAKLKANVAGSGDIEAAGLVASGAQVSIAGSGNVAATVKGAAAVSLVGSGDATLTGGAQCSVSAVGSGEAHCS